MTGKRVLHRWTVKDYHRLIGAGILGVDDRVELLDGLVVEKSPISSRRAACVRRLHKLLGSLPGERSIISIHAPVTLDDTSEPEPDVVVLKWKDNFYADAHPQPADVLLLIEVADSTALKDKHQKVPRYAAAGIPECWLVNLEAGKLEKYTEPSEEGYKAIRIHHPGESVQSEITGPVPLDDILP